MEAAVKAMNKSSILIFLIAVMALAGAVALAAQDKDSAQAAQGRVTEKFKQTGLLLGNDIQVAVAEKTVTLTGTVRNLLQKEQAGREAEGAAKGFKVENNIVLAPSGRSPQQIAEAVMAAIENNPSYFIFDYVGLAVTPDGAVTLKGWTIYPWSTTDLVKAAKSQPGVQKVASEIGRILSSDSDQNLRLQVARLLYLRPTGPGFSRMTGPIHILVQNNVVTLGGTVEKESDIDAFERQVRYNTSASNVINFLRLRKKE
jgi:osmotically-inducible protein OsmY